MVEEDRHHDGRISRRRFLISSAWGAAVVTAVEWSAGHLAAEDAPASMPPPDAALVTCPQCDGKGVYPCPNHCNNGKVRCPGNCLKPDDWRWRVKAVPGHDANDKWIIFPVRKEGMKGEKGWDFGHCGQVIAYKDGYPVNLGACPICKGTCVIDCSVCKGSGHKDCTLCLGKKLVTQAVASAYAKQLLIAHEKSAIHLMDGRILFGKLVGCDGDEAMIRTEDGKIITEKTDNLPLSMRPTIATTSPAASGPIRPSRPLKNLERRRFIILDWSPVTGSAVHLRPDAAADS